MLLLHKNNINVYLACNFVCMTNIVSYVFVISMSNTCIADHDLDTLVALNPCYIYLFLSHMAWYVHIIKSDYAKGIWLAWFAISKCTLL